MRSIVQLLCALTLCAFAGAAAAATPATPATAAPRDGQQYLTLPDRQPTAPGPKVEVVEFFAYYCPHCHSFEPALNAWVKKQGNAISFKRVHITLSASVAPQQRLFYTLESMGLAEQFHAKAFAAMHEQRLRLSSDEQVFDWAAGAGLDRAKFIDVYRSFAVQTKVNRAGAQMAAYRIDQWPMIAIDGRFLTSPYHAGATLPRTAGESEQQQAALAVMDFLVAKAKAEKK